eukprot:2286584-Amphidinium_carterae.1
MQANGKSLSALMLGVLHTALGAIGSRLRGWRQVACARSDHWRQQGMLGVFWNNTFPNATDPDCRSTKTKEANIAETCKRDVNGLRLEA